MSLRYEDLRKSHAEYAVKLEKEKEAAFGMSSSSDDKSSQLTISQVALKRTKGQYDGVCQEVESRRKKIESSFDSRYCREALFHGTILIHMD